MIAPNKSRGAEGETRPRVRLRLAHQTATYGGRRIRHHTGFTVHDSSASPAQAAVAQPPPWRPGVVERKQPTLGCMRLFSPAAI